jgi:UDP-N-acetylmuramoylalanine--D-glutamate ligase
MNTRSDYKKYFEGKNITIMGLGLLGRQINVAKFLAECGANLLVTDLKEKEELGSALEALKQYENIEYHLGGHRLDDFRNKDMIIKAAGVPLDSPYIEEAHKHQIPVEMDASLFLELAPRDIKIIGVTGTRGKSTVTQLISHVLDAAGKRVFIGGNIRGIATLPVLKRILPGNYMVMELDSWQLQGFGEAKISPDISVFTTFMSDHLNYYKKDVARYFQDKSYIFKYQTEDNVLVVSEQAKPFIDKYYDGDIKSRMHIIGEEYLPAGVKLKMQGAHNRYNAALALKALEEAGVEREFALEHLADVESLSGRLEEVALIDGVKVYNDTNSTTPDALSAALLSFEKGKIILIAGGTDKKLSYSDVTKEIDDRVKKLILLSGTATEKIKRYLTMDHVETENINTAVKEAMSAAEEGDVLLFSPGAASFGLFKNEYDRGEQFIEAVDELIS